MMIQESGQDNSLQSQIRQYWNERIHDREIAISSPGSPQFYQELDEYRFEKLDYLPKLVDFSGFRGLDLLEVGCGVGTDLLRFARGGARVTGVDLSATAIELARQNFDHAGQTVTLAVMDGEALEFPSNRFDVVYAHGVLQYTADPARMVREIYRVLRPGGQGILMAYNRHSWLMLLFRLSAVALEHHDAPAFNLYSMAELRQLLRPFGRVEIVPERFPVSSRRQHGVKAAVFNAVFVPAFRLLPRAWVRPWGWHLMAFVRKGS
jgi:SAM-dependent methyltransferase